MFHTILVNPLFNLLVLIYALLPGHDFGVAVIIMTILIRLALWPLVSKQLHSQKALQELQPEMAKIKAKAKGDKQLETKLTMELYKEKEISPFSSLLPVLIQLPLFIAFYVTLKEFVHAGAIAQLTYGSLRSLPLVKDIIAGGVFKPSLFGLVDLTIPNLPLAIAAGISQFFATKQLMPKAEGQAQPGMKLTMYLFPLITFSVALRLPAALALYWTVTSLVAILQQYILLRRDADELEAKGDKK